MRAAGQLVARIQTEGVHSVNPSLTSLSRCLRWAAARPAHSCTTDPEWIDQTQKRRVRPELASIGIVISGTARLSPFVLVRAQAMRRDERLPLPRLHCRQPRPCTLRLRITPACRAQDTGEIEGGPKALLHPSFVSSSNDSRCSASSARNCRLGTPSPLVPSSSNSCAAAAR